MGKGRGFFKFVFGEGNVNVFGGIGVVFFDLFLGGDVIVFGGLGVGEEVGEEGRTVFNVFWEE